MPFSGLESEEAQGIAMWEMDRGRKQKDMADLQQTRQFNHLSVNTAEKQNDQKIMVDGGYRYINIVIPTERHLPSSQPQYLASAFFNMWIGYLEETEKLFTSRAHGPSPSTHLNLRVFSKCYIYIYISVSSREV